MIKIISTFIFLLLCQSASSFQFDLLKVPEDSKEIFFSPEETEEISAICDVEFSGLQKDLQKIKINSGSDFSFFSVQAWPIRKISGVDQEIITNFNTNKIIYPFHSFL